MKKLKKQHLLSPRDSSEFKTDKIASMFFLQIFMCNINKWYKNTVDALLIWDRFSFVIHWGILSDIDITLIKIISVPY